MGKSSNLLSELLQVDVFNVGEFMLKGNHTSPFYVDLRHIPSYPKILNNVVKEMRALSNKLGLEVDAVCGVPYNGLPFAAAFSSRHEIPLLLKRKETKTYGTKKLIEGVFVRGTTCLILEDVVVSGASIKETADSLRKVGLVVTDCITILDRLQGAKENLSKFGIKLHALFNINDILSLYCSLNEIKPSVVEEIRVYLRHNICSLEVAPAVSRKLPFAKRAESCSNPVLRRLFQIIEKKRSNLCVAVDALQSSELLKVAAQVAPHICMLKTHIDVLSDFSDDIPSKLRALAAEHDFLILEDRKFADIGNTVQHQYESGIYSIAQWADVVTVHGIPGSGVLESLKEASKGKERACLLIAQMSSKGALTDDHYAQQIVQLGESHPDFVMGFISQEKLSSDGNFIHVCPGVNVACEGDSLGQQYRMLEEVMAKGVDIVIVGRGICASSNVSQTALEYKNRAYNAYLKSCSESR